MNQSDASKAHPLARMFAHPLTSVTLLLVATLAALAWANSPWGAGYQRVFHLPLGVSVGDFTLRKPLLLWINDGLMGIFFFLVGLEIKRELLVGELARPRKAALSVAAALGGMLVPALLFLSLQRGRPASFAQGWGIPMSTDIAFALGMLGLLGSRVPLGLRVFLTALAIVDDIGAVLVIAVFYTDSIALVSLVAGLLLFSVAIAANRMRVRNSLFYFLLGTLVWLAFLKSGVHATIAALLMAFVIPARTRIDPGQFSEQLSRELAAFSAAPNDGSPRLLSVERQILLDRMSEHMEGVRAPLQSLEHQLEPLVKKAILPIFALANAGVALGGASGGAGLAHPVSLGIILGLTVGKPLGVALFSFVAVKLGIAELPAGVRWSHVVGAGMLSGIGFTMALFVTGLAFDDTPGDPALVAAAKLGILTASALSAVAGLSLLHATLREVKR